MESSKIRKIIQCIVFIAACFVLISCSPQKRLNRLVKNNPELLQTKQIIHDTIIIQETRFDSVFSVYFDTINIEQEKLQLKIIRVSDTLYLSAICKADTIYRTHEVSVLKVDVKHKDKTKLFNTTLLIISAFVFISILLYFNLYK
jgi:hypothetical protein